MSNQAKTILITGVSSGFGRAFAEAALKDGYCVVGTVRRQEDASQFEQLHPTHAYARLLDITHEQQITETVADIKKNVGQIDVLIANAGYGHEGLFEEASMQDLRRQFEVNVFGTVAIIKAVLPAMRQRHSGRILAITSVGGLVTSPGLSFYHGSKFAMEGILEALGKEVAGLGVFVTAVEPGPFRTDWSGRSMSHSERTISDYDQSYEPIRTARKQANGNQPGDPLRAAQAILEVILAETPPKHLLLGSAAIDAVHAAQAAFNEDATKWAALSRSTDYSAYK